METIERLNQYKNGTRMAALSVEQTRYVINVLEDRIANLRKFADPDTFAEETETAAGALLEMYFALENTAEN